MKKGMSGFSRLFVAVMLAFSLAAAACTVIRAGLDFSLEDTARSLETSRGRERKQQAEYDEASAALPLVLEELAGVQPKAEAAAEAVSALKEERKRLRQVKKEMEAPEAAEGEES